MRFSARNTFLIITAVIAINAVLWLDSLDGYLGARYHVQLTEYLPQSVFTPSRFLEQVLGHPEQNGAEEDVASDHEDTPAAEVPPGSGPASSGPATASSGQKVLAAAPSAATGSAPPVAASAVTEPASASSQPVAARVPPRILFAGDSMMEGLAPFVIYQLKKLYPDGYFSDQSKQSTGLTVKRYFDWPTRIRDQVIQQKFNTLVIFLGPNDPWDIFENGKRYVFPTEGWIDEYRNRVADVLEFCKEHQVKVIWVGLPNMRSQRIKEGAVLENRIFREETARFGFDFFPTEPIIGRLDEPFHKRIDDPVKGRILIRANDGVHFTPAGLRMISSELVELMKTKLQ